MSTRFVKTAQKNAFFKGIPENIPTIDTGELSVSRVFLSNIMTEALVVLDFHRKNFSYIFVATIKE